MDSTEGLSAHVKKDLLSRISSAKTGIRAAEQHVLDNIKSYIRELSRCEETIEKSPTVDSSSFLADYKNPEVSRIARVCDRIEHKAKDLKKYY